MNGILEGILFGGNFLGVGIITNHRSLSFLLQQAKTALLIYSLGVCSHYEGIELPHQSSLSPLSLPPLCSILSLYTGEIRSVSIVQHNIIIKQHSLSICALSPETHEIAASMRS